MSAPRRFLLISIFALLMVAVHLFAIWAGLYEGKVWIDIPLHFTGGILLGVLWLSVLRSSRAFGNPSPLFVSISVAGFSLFGSFLWELFELFLYENFPLYAGAFKLYSLNVQDALSDMALGFLGGVAVALKEYMRFS